MAFWEVDIRNMRHRLDLMRRHPNMLQDQHHSTLFFGEIAHLIPTEPIGKTSISQNQKATSCSQIPLAVNNKAAQTQAGSEKSSSRVQRNLTPVNIQQVPPRIDTSTAVSNWLATSQTFNTQPMPAIGDPILQDRSCQEYWLQVSNCLDLAIKSRSERSKPVIHLNSGSECVNPDIKSGNSKPQPQTKLSAPAKHAPPGQLNTVADTAVPSLPNTRGPAQKQERERKTSIEANTFEVQGMLEQGGLEAINSKQADGAAKATAKQPEAAKPKQVDEAVMALAGKKRLTADAMAAHREERERERERKDYVDRRARDIHENLLQCRPFDIDAVRREFSEREVLDIQKTVRELGFAKTESMN